MYSTYKNIPRLADTADLARPVLLVGAGVAAGVGDGGEEEGEERELHF